jgi:hypothetical protein
MPDVSLLRIFAEMAELESIPLELVTDIYQWVSQTQDLLNRAHEVTRRNQPPMLNL